jgi:hypothetical protein
MDAQKPVADPAKPVAQPVAQPAKPEPVAPVRQRPITMNVDTGKPSSSLPPLTQYPKPTPNLPLYDKGGDVKAGKGRHQLAILKDGEKVLTPEQAKEYGKGKSMAEHSPEEKKHFSRAMHKLHAGGLHKALGISEDKPIPMEKKQEAAASSNKHTAAMGRLAVAMHGWKH